MKTFTKTDVTFHEFQMYQHIDSLHLPFIPKLIKYDPAKKTLTMQHIQGMTLSDFYGENFDVLPDRVTDELRDMISTLYGNNIVYPDITGYNFMLEEGTDNFWLIDFEHCYFSGATSYMNHTTFVREFISGKQNCWNPYFA